MNNRVVITGMGALTPLGNTVEEYWDGLLAGKSGIGTITRFDVSDYSTKIAAELKDFNPTDFVDRKEARRWDMVQVYAIASSQMAIDDSGLDTEAVDPDRCGVIIGSGIGGIQTLEAQHKNLTKGGPGKVSPFFIPMMIVDMAPGLVSMRFGFRGPNYATVSACASSSHAIADAFYSIQRGESDVIITGGTEATISPISVAGFCQAKAMSTRNDEPEKASRPFDNGRDGFVMGEGTGMLILESLEHAQKRGAKIYGEILGAGMTGDAHHITAPHPEGAGAKNAMKMALANAGLAPEKISYINTHGTATGLGDIAETKAIKAVFGDHAFKIPCNSTKSMAGHMLGAAGAIEFIATMKSIETGLVHPTINQDDPDPECDLDYVPNVKREHQVEYALSNSFGFGGHNVTLVGGKYNG